MTERRSDVADPLVRELADACQGQVRSGAPLAELTTLKVGGAARVLVTAEDDADLIAVGRAAVRHAVPWLVVGRGSNLLVADRGWPGIAVQLGRAYRHTAVDGTILTAGAAEPLPVLAVRAAREGLGGFAWAAAVPGSLGGAVRMNAGAHDSELSDHLLSADVIRLRSGERETLTTERLRPRYRHTELPDDAVVVAARLRLTPADGDHERARIAEVKRWRRDHQPVNHPSCGSVFTNPPGDSAGRLVDSAGGKGLRVGRASVSRLHANFILTEPGATAADVHELIRRLQALIRDTHGVELRPEVVQVGDFSDGADAADGAVRAGSG